INLNIEQSHTNDTSIFLTGVTGFLGIFLLYNLIKKTNLKVICLIRPSANKNIQEKLKDILLKYLLFDKFTQFEFKRIILVSGDLSEPNLGLSEDNYNNIVSNSYKIIHCGAEVNFGKSYNSLRKSNVLSAIELCKLSHKIQRQIHYISSDSVF